MNVTKDNICISTLISDEIDLGLGEGEEATQYMVVLGSGNGFMSVVVPLWKLWLFVKVSEQRYKRYKRNKRNKEIERHNIA